MRPERIDRYRVSDGFVTLSGNAEQVIVLEINPDIVGPMRVRMDADMASAIGKKLEQLSRTVRCTHGAVIKWINFFWTRDGIPAQWGRCECGENLVQIFEPWAKIREIQGGGWIVET